MSERVTLPPGCGGFTTADGRTLKAKPGTSIVLDDRDAAVLKRSQHASIGLVTRPSHRLATKDGRWCVDCRRLWQGWSLQCPKCDALTVPEEEMNEPPAGAGDFILGDLVPDNVAAKPRRYDYTFW